MNFESKLPNRLPNLLTYSLPKWILCITNSAVIFGERYERFFVLLDEYKDICTFVKPI
jgi:hypothetical protein